MFMSDGMKVVYLRNLLLFRNLEEIQLEHIASLARIKYFKEGDILSYGQGAFSRIYFLISGKVKVTEQGANDDLIKDVLTDGEIFGDLALDGSPTEFECALALKENTVVCWMNASDFTSVLQAYPSIAIFYARSISSKLKRLEDRHSDLMQHDVKSRLVRFLKNWALTEGSDTGDKIILNNYLTHNDIAGMISSSRQTVSVLFKELKDSGLLHYNRKLIQLNDSSKWRQAV